MLRSGLFEIDTDELQRVADELGAMPKEIYQSYNRALKRTAATLRKLSSKGLVSELGLSRAKALRKRLKTIRAKGRFKGKEIEDLGEIRLWFGLNDLPVSEFKGRVNETPDGAAYSGPAGSHGFPGAFVAKPRGSRKRTILRRRGASRVPIYQETLPIEEKAQVFLEDHVFDQLEDIFWRHFRDDLERRVAYLRAS